MQISLGSSKWLFTVCFENVLSENQVAYLARYFSRCTNVKIHELECFDKNYRVHPCYI